MQGIAAVFGCLLLLVAGESDETIWALLTSTPEGLALLLIAALVVAVVVIDLVFVGSMIWWGIRRFARQRLVASPTA